MSELNDVEGSETKPHRCSSVREIGTYPIHHLLEYYIRTGGIAVADKDMLSVVGALYQVSSVSFSL